MDIDWNIMSITTGVDWNNPLRQLNNEPTAAPTATDQFVSSTDTEIIRETLRLYGSAYLLLFFSFSFLRIRYPRLYNIRSWVPEFKCKLAVTQSYGFISWAWRVFSVTDDELLDQCGMDALCFLRCLRMGSKLSFFGLMNSIWLIPTYLTAKESVETAYLTDKFIQMSISNLPSDSPRYAGTVLAAYLIFFYSMHLITKEYDWFIEYRHKFLSKRIPRNYAIYVSGIPEEYRTSYALGDYFRGSWNSAVVETSIAVEIPKLGAKVARREKILEKLEHAMALEKKKGVTQTHLTYRFSLIEQESSSHRVQKVDSVEAYKVELKTLNREISLEIGGIVNSNHRLRHHMMKSKTTNIKGQQLDLQLSPTTSGCEGAGDGRDSFYNSSVTLESSLGKIPPSSCSEQLDSICEDNGEGVVIGDLPTNEGCEDQIVFEMIQEAESSPTVNAELKTMADDGPMQRRNSPTNPLLEIFGLTSLFDNAARNPTEETTPSDSTCSITPTIDSKDSPETSDDIADYTADEEEFNENDDAELDIEKPSQHDEENPKQVSFSKTLDGIASTNSGLPGIEEEFRNRRNGIGLAGGAQASVSMSRRNANRHAGIVGGALSKSAEVVSVRLKKAVHDVKPEMVTQGVKRMGSLGVQGVRNATEIGISAVGSGAATILASAAAVAPVLSSGEDGQPRSAGFIVFRDLFTTHAARQMLQHPSGKTL
jgi:hypothetical protein